MVKSIQSHLWKLDEQSQDSREKSENGIKIISFIFFQIVLLFWYFGIRKMGNQTRKWKGHEESKCTLKMEWKGRNLSYHVFFKKKISFKMRKINQRCQTCQKFKILKNKKNNPKIEICYSSRKLFHIFDNLKKIGFF